MKIAIIHSRLNIKGGSQRHCLAYASALQQLGHDITVYVMAYERERCFPEMLDKLRVRPLAGYHPDKQKSKSKWLKFFNYFVYSRRESRAAQSLAAQIQDDTDILFAHDRLAFRVATFAKKRLGIPSVLMMADILTKSWASWRQSELDARLALPLRTRMFYKLIDAYEMRRFIKPHDALIVVDTRTKEWAKRYFHKDAVVVRNGIEIDTFPYREHSSPRQNAVKLLAVGIFFVHRRYEDIIKAAAILRKRGVDVKLVIAGDNQTPAYAAYGKVLYSLVAELNLRSRVSFPGRISEEELIRLYGEYDMYISANHLQSWGLAVFEAMACGMPVIVSKTAGASEVLTHGENALLVNPKAPEEIADAVEHLIKNPSLYAHMSERGRKFVEANISWERSAKSVVEIFEKLQAKKVGKNNRRDSF